VNNQWRGVGYYVEGTNFGVGTLYRFSQSTNHIQAPTLSTAFINEGDTHRVSDGIVHFRLDAVYPQTNNPTGRATYEALPNFTFPLLETPTDAMIPLPPFVDVEIGILEPATLKQFNALTNNQTAALNFLQEHIGRIHFFRDRVPIRNFINPYRLNEVP
jgi:hypothetical protein